MIDEDEDIHTEDELDLSTELTVTTKTTAPRKGVGRGFVIGGVLLSALFGGAIGIVGTKILAGPDKTTTLKTELEQTLTELQNFFRIQTETLEQQITDLQKTVAGNTAATEIAATETKDRIAVLEALSSEDEDVFTGAGSIAARLNSLEGKVTDMQPFSPQDMLDTSSELLPLVKAPIKPVEEAAAISEDENHMPAAPLADTKQQTALNILIDTFPRQKLLAAVKAQEISAASKPGWLKRTLSKHIKVSVDDPADPYVVIDAAEAALKDGEITKSLAQISKLNPPVRIRAAEWTQTAKKAASVIENQ